MKLWTWQSKDFSIIDPSKKVDSLKYSPYLAEQIPESERQRFFKVYKKLWDLIGTCQFHWYSTNKKDVGNPECHKGKLLWEVDLPQDRIFKVVCSSAWFRLIGRNDYVPEYIRDFWFRKEPWNYDRLEKKFKAFWEKKTEDQLWGLLLLDSSSLRNTSSFFLEIIKQCTQILIRHPVREEWVTKNPFKLDNWWESQK